MKDEGRGGKGGKDGGVEGALIATARRVTLPSELSLDLPEFG